MADISGMNCKRVFSALVLAVFVSTVFAQLNMTVLGNLDYQALHNSDISDVWGYADEFGNEVYLRDIWPTR